MVDPKLNSKMMEALNSGNMDAVAEALDSGADPNIVLDDGNPLFVAMAFNGDLELIKLFLSKKVNINIKNQIGQTALSGALMNQNEELIDLLLENGADVDGTDSVGAPLGIVISTDDLVSAEKLLKKGANPNATYVQKVNEQMRNFLKEMIKSNAFKKPEKGMRIFVDEKTANDIVSKNLTEVKTSPMILATNGKSQKMIALLKKYGGK